LISGSDEPLKRAQIYHWTFLAQQYPLPKPDRRQYRISFLRRKWRARQIEKSHAIDFRAPGSIISPSYAIPPGARRWEDYRAGAYAIFEIGHVGSR